MNTFSLIFLLSNGFSVEMARWISRHLLFYSGKLHVRKGEVNKSLDYTLHRLSDHDNLDVVMNEHLIPLLS